MKYLNLLILNFYIFNEKKFFNEIIFKKINFKKSINYEMIQNFYFNVKYSLLNFNPFYGIKIESFFKKKKKKKKFFKHKYIIPYKDLTYIFKFSIEKIRMNFIKRCQKSV